MFLTDFFEK